MSVGKKEILIAEALESKEGREILNQIYIDGVISYIKDKQLTLNEKNYENFAISFLWAAGATKEQILDFFNNVKTMKEKHNNEKVDYSIKENRDKSIQEVLDPPLKSPSFIKYVEEIIKNKNK